MTNNLCCPLVSLGELFVVCVFCIKLFFRAIIRLTLRTWMPAIPPLLHLRGKSPRKQGKDCSSGPSARLKYLNGIGRTSACCNICNKTAANSSPAGFFALPNQT